MPFPLCLLYVWLLRVVWRTSQLNILSFSVVKAVFASTLLVSIVEFHSIMVVF